MTQEINQKRPSIALGLRNSGRVEVWIRQYRREGVEAFSKPIGHPRKVAQSEDDELVRLRMENTSVLNSKNIVIRCRLNLLDCELRIESPFLILGATLVQTE